MASEATQGGVGAGIAYLARGLRLWITSPQLMLLGAVPALIVGLVYTAAITFFVLNLDGIAVWATPFAAEWRPLPRIVLRFVVGAALVAGAVVIGIYSFVAMTLAVGDPFYERIWRVVETRLGDAPDELDESLWRSASRGIGNGLRLLLATASLGLILFVAGFIPVIGQIGAPIAGALFGGWFLAVELGGFAFDARGLSLRDRRRMLRARRSTTLGFGIVTYLLFLVPGAAIIVMPAAVAGATMLSRDALALAQTADRASSVP